MKSAAALLSATALIVGLSACSSGGGTGSAGGSASDVTAALKKGGALTVWSWTPQAQAKVDAFEKAYPKVKVKLVNAGSGADEYQKLSNAIKAGDGVPDVAQIDYTTMPQYILGGDLANLSSYGLGSLKSKFVPGAWSAVVSDGGVYGLPEDSGPMSLYYNKKVFDEHGLTVPKTWDEYTADAKKLHDADPKEYLTSEAPDGLFAASMIWQAGGKPFTVDGSKITINLQDTGSKKWADTWNTLVEQKLLSPTPQWTDDWYKQLGNGQIASLVTAAWMPGLLETSAPAGAGDWRVAPMPTYDGGASVSANNGGCAEAVLKASKNPALAAGFLKFINTDDAAIKAMIDKGSYPSTVAALKSPALADVAPAYFGGQKINQVALAAGEHVNGAFQYLPYFNYANQIFTDSVGQAYANHTDLNAGLQQWQKALVAYGNQQGFTVKAG